MQLSRWLLANNVRLNVILEAAFDPRESEPIWQCEIGGILETTGTRPATFILTPSGGVTASAQTPGDAFREAVHKLRGEKVNAIYRSRNDVYTFPQDLTV
jgi:hypothetical protein